MQKNRLEAFSDGVIAIIITIMVLEMKIPHGTDLAALKSKLPTFLSYVLSFIYVGIYWNNHHHLLHATKKVSGGVLWANLHLLFWLSLFPFATAWLGETWMAEDHQMIPTVPTAVYGVILLMAASAYYILQCVILAQQGRESLLAKALGQDWKGKISPVLYATAIALSFQSPRLASAVYALVALMWLVPDRRIERELARHET